MPAVAQGHRTLFCLATPGGQHRIDRLTQEQGENPSCAQLIPQRGKLCLFESVCNHHDCRLRASCSGPHSKRASCSGPHSKHRLSVSSAVCTLPMVGSAVASDYESPFPSVHVKLNSAHGRA